MTSTMNGNGVNGNGTREDTPSYHNGHTGDTPDGLTNRTTNGGTNGQTNGHHAKGHNTSHINAGENGQANSMHPPNVPVAICGMGLRLPGKIRKDSDLFGFLSNHGDARQVVPKTRYNIDSFYDPLGRPGTIVSKHGYFIEDDLDQFDSSMFSMTPAEVLQLDPGQRLLLEVTREALESAGEANYRGKPIGTYVGAFSEDWKDMRMKDTMDYSSFKLFGRADFVMSNRLAYEYDLQGPSMTIKTACSAAAQGVHEAVSAIRCGHCTGAIVAGANLNLAPDSGIALTAQGTLAPDGNCKTFDSAGDGYARGESVSCLYIKRLDLAIRDGNPIRGVIRSSASNADGASKGFSNPSAQAQEIMIRHCYRDAGLELSDTRVVECHGTGTAAGDPIEVAAIAACFGDKGAYIGSVKPNLGHSEGASGITSIAKAVLALENRTILPNIKLKNPSPQIPWKKSKLSVPLEPIPWPDSYKERMSVNCFGIGGSNVHFIIESAASMGLARPTAIPASLPLPHEVNPRRKSLLVFSGGGKEAVEQLAHNHKSYLDKYPERLEEVSFNLLQKREAQKFRSYAVVDPATPSEFTASPPSSDNQSKKTAFIFTGQGAQWVHMGRELLEAYPTFLHSIRGMDEVLASIECPPSWTIEGTIRNLKDGKALSAPELAQPICCALQIALVDLLAEFQIRPFAVAGHSSGEIAAAYAAGALTSREALLVAFYRGVSCTQVTSKGSMAAVGLGRQDVAQFLRPGVGIACENSGSSVTLSGDEEVLESVLDKIREALPKAFVRKLLVPVAYHSAHMREVSDSFHDMIAPHLKPKPTTIPYFSTVRAKKIGGPENVSAFDAHYWRDNLENPVLFHLAMKNLMAELADEKVMHIEIGPHGALAGPLRQIYIEQGTDISYASVLTRGDNDQDSFLSMLGKAYCTGIELKFPFPPAARIPLVDLPTYPWHYAQPFFVETRAITDWKRRKHGIHELLGVKIPETSSVEPTWRNVIRLRDLPWLQDHCVGKDIVFPAAGYISMMGEAAMQMTGATTYTVRGVNIAAAMLLHENEDTEVHLSLRKQRLSSMMESQWFECSISSHYNGTWSKHCWGLAFGGKATFGPSSKHVESFSKPVSPRRWYKTMARVGLNYGPKFTGITDITADTTSRSAAMTVHDSPEENCSFYPLHPTTIDFVLQSWSVASVQGEYREFTKLFLPTYIGEFYVGPGTERSISINTVAKGDRNAALGESFGYTDGELAFYMHGFNGTPLLDQGSASNPLKVMQLQWTPDFDFTEVHKLMKPTRKVTEDFALLERMYIYCALELRDKLEGANPCAEHFEQYRYWLNERCRSDDEPSKWPLTKQPSEFSHLSSEERKRKILKCKELAKDTDLWTPIQTIWHCYEHGLDIFEGRVELLDLLTPERLFTKFYDWLGRLTDLSALFKSLGHSKPLLKILEVGAGTGATTGIALENLVSEYGERLYSSYTVTDISPGFFPQCQERFKEYEGVEYRVLDVCKDPEEQGFTEGEYDLIIASNVIHATPSVVGALTACRKLLKPDGHLMLQEVDTVWMWCDFIFGMFSGWWLGSKDGRVSRPVIPPAEWDVRLKEAGFEGVNAIGFDNNQPYQMNATMIAKPQLLVAQPPKVTLLTVSEKLSPFAASVQDLLRRADCTTEHHIWGKGPLPPNQDTIALMDVEQDDPLLKNLRQEDFDALKSMIDDLADSRLLWISRPAQIGCADPHRGEILGLARVERLESMVGFATLELNPKEPNAAYAVVSVLQKLQRTTGNDSLDTAAVSPDMEFALVNREICVSRFHWYPVAEGVASAIRDPDARELFIGTRGMLQTLRWRSVNFHPLGEDEVELRVSAVGMNFLDLAMAINIVDTTPEVGAGYGTMGKEGIGYITKVGAGVTHLKVGDRVAFRGVDCTGFATRLQRPAGDCNLVPEGLKDVDAAGFWLPYMTVLWSLVDKANLQRGQSVLIHSAAGGVGIAAIEIARWLGADVFVTVGTPEKRKYLNEKHGIPEDRIFSSRDDSFLDGVMRATNGKGVDVVLNSLSGELLHASWKCVASSGSMAEIGKRDFVGRATLAMKAFEDNRAFFGIDIWRLSFNNRPAMMRLAQKTMELYQQGHIHEIYPTTVFEAEKVEDAFRYMQKGIHMGRIAIKMPEDETLLPLSTSSSVSQTFRSDVTYIMIGGLGGLGRSIISWMASGDAKHIMVISRSAGKSEANQAFVRQMRDVGCILTCMAGDVADEDFVKDCISKAELPIAGVMQMAMVLRDMSFTNMDYDSWQTALRPKVDGTWNLHRHLPSNLDFFVLFSSTSGTLGLYGQSNYAAANTFLDAFVQYRHSQGLPASVLDICFVGDVGYVAEQDMLEEQADKLAGQPIREQEFLDALYLAVVRSGSQFTVSSQDKSPSATYRNQSQITMYNRNTIPLSDPESSIIWKNEPRMSIYHNMEQATTSDSSGSSGSENLRRFIASVITSSGGTDKLDQPSTSAFFAQEIAKKAATFLMKSEEAVPTTQTLAGLGVDSLVTIEIRNWWKTTFGTEVSVLELQDGGSIEKLGELAVQRLRDKVRKGK